MPRPRTGPPRRPRLLKSTERSPRPLTVAITGGIGAGKSEALQAFARRGTPAMSSDEVVHRLLREDGEVKSALADRFGSEVIGGEGADRAALARLVFTDRAELIWLEELLHPKVVREYHAWRDELAKRPEPPRVAVMEVPLLYETGGEGRFDAVLVITAAPGVREQRRPVSDERAMRLIPDEEKARRADYVYSNEGSLDELDAFVADLLERLG